MLAYNTPVEGTLKAGESQSWTVALPAGAVVSFIAETLSGNLDPQIQILSSANTIIISNDDYQYPIYTDALLEAITIPRTDTYTVRVSSFGDSAGNYRLTMLPGYATRAAYDDFAEIGNWLIWQASDQSDPSFSIENNRLNASIEGISQRAVLLDQQVALLANFYAQTQINIDTGRGGWQVGLALRTQPDGRHYAFSLNQQGLWRFDYIDNNTSTTIRDWTSHPAIVPGATEFTLAALANGNGFDFFYDGQFVGSAFDTTLPQAGQVGLIVASAPALNSATFASFSDFIITKPFEQDGRPIFPLSFIVESANATMSALQRRQLVPAGGEQILTVGQSTWQSPRPGVFIFPLGGSLSVENVVIATTVNIRQNGEGIGGCGLVLRVASDNQYILAYLDTSGSYGLSQRNGDNFQPGVFGQNEQLIGNNEHHLLVTAYGENLHYYIDGQYVGSITATAIAGGVGNAVVNFDPVDSTCSFRDLWVWRWTN